MRRFSPQTIQSLAGQQQALVGLLGQLGQIAHQVAEVRQAERDQLQVGAQFLGVLAAVTSRSPYFAQLAGSA